MINLENGWLPALCPSHLLCSCFHWRFPSSLQSAASPPPPANNGAALSHEAMTISRIYEKHEIQVLSASGAFVPGIATSVLAQDTTYVWQSADGDPFNIQGTVVLDSPSSANGSATDVVSLSITDTVDSYSWTPATGGGAGALFFGIGTDFASTVLYSLKLLL